MDKTAARTVKAGPVSQIAPGQGFTFVAFGEEIAVFRQRDGTLFATQNRCPHKNGPLSEGIVGDGKVICPLHAWKFDLATGEGPEKSCLKVYPVREAEGFVLVDL
jgi:nitrite reductase (NADH) small subunit